MMDRDYGKAKYATQAVQGLTGNPTAGTVASDVFYYPGTGGCKSFSEWARRRDDETTDEHEARLNRNQQMQEQLYEGQSYELRQYEVIRIDHPKTTLQLESLMNALLAKGVTEYHYNGTVIKFGDHAQKMYYESSGRIEAEKIQKEVSKRDHEAEKEEDELGIPGAALMRDPLHGLNFGSDS